MKIVVCIKEANYLPGPAILKEDASGVNPHFLQRRISEADENAVEEALKLASQHDNSQTIAICAGNEKTEQTLRKCLALGIQRALRIDIDDEILLDPLAVAAALAEAIRSENPNLVLCGVQSSDLAQQATGPALAANLDLPFTPVVVSLTVNQDGQSLTAERELGAGRLEVLEVTMPSVLTVQTGMNTPRSATFANTRKSKKAPVETFDYSGRPNPRIKLAQMELPETAGKNTQLLEGEPAAIAEKIKSILKEAAN
ncbi:electron transfer flavoprotein subunit beta/FixA family protein [Hyphococcus sp.]|uniref:electron transfer flavoprotein subunit beta/FixA family protein n=1 Tax=Hyphococcus sp. TaxID=2038636 RepID=UPI003CCC166C